MGKLLIISYDAVGNREFDRLLTWPNFAALAGKSQINRDVSSVFLTNTYPVHASVVTGVPAAVHRLTNNTDPFPLAHAPWHYQASRLKAKTLWQAAHQKGLSVAAVMWPVTGGAREIRYNVPELMAQPGQNQVLLNLKFGSKLLQLGLFAKYRHLLRGISQPELDSFSASCMADILQKKSPDLALMHLTAYDSLCHHYGCGSPQLETALASLDGNLGKLLAAAGPDYDVIVFSDHAQLPAETPLLPNQLLAEMGLLEKGADGCYLPGNCYFECSGGSAFLHADGLDDTVIDEIKRRTALLEGFNRMLRSDELAVCGRAELPFGFAAKPGWACEAYPSDEKANHGYPVDYPDYQVFYLVKAAGQLPGSCTGGSLLDIAPIAARLLGLDMDFTAAKNPAYQPLV